MKKSFYVSVKEELNNVIRESSRLTGINFCSFKCFSERTSLFSALFVDLKAFEDIKHHFTCKTF